MITSKILAIFIGPSGMALAGNFKNFMTSIESIATLGFQNGIVKYIVEKRDQEAEFKKIMSTVFISLLSVSLLLSLVLFAFSSYWTRTVLDDTTQYAMVFKILALVLPWYATTAFLIVVLNGLGKYRSVIYVNIVGNILGLLFAVAAVYYFKTFGALLSIIIPPSLLFFVVFYYLNKDIRFFDTISRHSFDVQVLKNLSSYSLMALVSSVFGSWVFLAIRKNIITGLGVEQAGYWEAMTRISNYYLLFISTMLTVYFFPKLAFSTSKKATKNVFWSYYNGVLPLFVVGLTVLFFLRFFLIRLFFTKAFFPVADLFFWQLLGDVFKAASLILGYQFFAKKLTLAFITTEIFSLTLMYTFCHFFMTAFGIQGIVMAHALTYFIYWIVLVIYFRKSLFG
ncbi:O-antigen translocase [Flavobacterium sp.]|uniref:O-antigen translocase n=1 Tax=Flavobacterium sp. TaxID=239 RepID=UPI00263A2394|nr:O-antigen translocase [Flavobacterium sp.]